MQERKYARLFLFACALALLYLNFQIFRPFLFPFTLAVILTTLCYPAYDRVCRFLKGGRSWAALLSCLAVTGLIVVPFLLLIVLLAAQVSQLYQQFQRSLDRGELQALLDLRKNAFLSPLLQIADRYLPLDDVDLLGSLAEVVKQVSLFFLHHSKTIVSSLFRLVMDFLIMMVTMFFLFRDGSRLFGEIRSWTPLSYTQERAIVDRFREVTQATVVGNLLTALAQGVAGGLVFWILGISNPLLWGFLTALFSMVPVVGTALVWVPWAIYFFSTGMVLRGVILVVLEVFFVGMIDNFLRPLLIEGKTKMHTLLVFFSLLGGITYFGMAGMLLGPLVVALGLTFVELYKLEFREELSRSLDQSAQ